jgi:hypothetical protein
MRQMAVQLRDIYPSFRVFEGEKRNLFFNK